MQDRRAFKQALYGQFARIGSALASDRRLELLDLLAQGPRHVEALAAETEMSMANVSQHLQILRNARLVESNREGNRVLYQLADGSVLGLWLALRDVGERRLAEIGQITRDFAVPDAGGEQLSREELRRYVQSNELFVLDVRPALEYEHGHLPGARSIPLDELPRRLEELPRDQRIVAYCRGTFCLFADEAVAMLRGHGFDAVRLDGGWLEWIAETHSAYTEHAGVAGA